MKFVSSAKMKILALTLILCATSALALDEGITDSPIVEKSGPKWTDDCPRNVEKVFMGKRLILNDYLSEDGEKLAEKVLKRRGCEALSKDRVAFCRFSKKSKKNSCKRALKDFMKSVKTKDNEVLGCGFSSRKERGSALVCLRKSEDEEKIQKRSTIEDCKKLITNLYNNNALITQDTELESQAKDATVDALEDNKCDYVDANRCNLKTNAGSEAVKLCSDVTEGISKSIKRRIGCNFTHTDDLKAVIACVFKKD